MIFEAFEERSQWSTAELLKATDQPSAYLREVLDAVAVFRSGVWMLKDAFARTKTRGSALAALPVSHPWLNSMNILS